MAPDILVASAVHPLTRKGIRFHFFSNLINTN